MHLIFDFIPKGRLLTPTVGDLIWIHDYHLLLVPSLIRQALPDAAVGLFVHTPFPSSEVFRCVSIYIPIYARKD